jgi:hypothetical protein
MPPDAPAADNVALTIAQATADLDAVERKENEAPAQADAASTEEPNTEAEPAVEDAAEPETAIEGDNAETEDAEGEAEEAELPAIEPPRFWDAEAKKRFGELPPDLQELVLAKETERDKATAKSIEEAALKRKAAEGEASRIAQLNGVLDKLLPQAIETFKSRWQGVDWNAVVDQYGAEQALKLRNDFEREQGVVQQLQAAKDEAEQVQFSRFVEAETAKLPEMVPDLVDPKLGPERRAALGKFLIETGIPAENLKRISALETSIAYDAMRWRQAQAKAKVQAATPSTPAKTATPARPSVKPTAAANRGSPQIARIKALEAAYDKNPSVNNLEALLAAQGT